MAKGWRFCSRWSWGEPWDDLKCVDGWCRKIDIFLYDLWNQIMTWWNSAFILSALFALFFSSSGNVACRSDWEPYVLILVFFSVSFWDWFKSPKRVVESWIWWSFEFWFFRWSLHLAFSHDQICLQTVNVLIHISYIQIHNHWHRKKSSLTFQLVDCLSTGWDFWEGPSFLGHTQMMFQPSYS